MRNEGTDPDHVWTELFHEEKVFRKILPRLEGRTYHQTASCLETYLFEVIEAPLPVGQRQRRGVKFGIVCFTCGLMPEKISVRPGVEQPLV